MLSKSAMIAYDKGYRVIDGKVYRERKTYPNNRGYPVFTIRTKEKRLTVKAHQLAAWQKFGKQCIGRYVEIMHEDDNSLNFDLKNIKLGTKSENSIQRETNKKRDYSNIMFH